MASQLQETIITVTDTDAISALDSVVGLIQGVHASVVAKATELKANNGAINVSKVTTAVLNDTSFPKAIGKTVLRNLAISNKTAKALWAYVNNEDFTTFNAMKEVYFDSSKTRLHMFGGKIPVMMINKQEILLGSDIDDIPERIKYTLVSKDKDGNYILKIKHLVYTAETV